LAAELQAVGRMEEAVEIFEEQTWVTPSDNSFDPDSFWSINGVRDLPRQQQAVLKALNIYRDQEAKQRDLPHFKVLGNKTLSLLAQRLPRNFKELHQVHGMTHGQVRRYGHGILEAIKTGLNAPPPRYPKREKRPSDQVLNRYEKLHNWRKHRARQRGVESDVIISRHTLWHIAEANPPNQESLSQLDSVGAWRCQAYGQEILDVLHHS
jgi:ribonuclease D